MAGHGTEARTLGVTPTSRNTPTSRQAVNPRLFEELLPGPSLRLIPIPWDQIDGGIGNGLRAVCEFLGIQRATLRQGPRESLDKRRLTHPARTAVRPLRGRRGDRRPLRSGYCFIIGERSQETQAPSCMTTFG